MALPGVLIWSGKGRKASRFSAQATRDSARFALVRLMIKVAFASIPALVLLTVVLSLVLFVARWVAVAAGLGAR